MMSLEIVTNWFIRDYWNPECLLAGQYNGMGYGNSSWITGKCNSNMWVKYVSTCQTLCIQLVTWSRKRFLLFFAPLRARRELIWACRDSSRSGHVWAGRTTWSINHWHVSFKTWFGLWPPNVRVHEQEWVINNLRGTDPAQAGPCSARSFQWAEWRARWGGLGIWHQTETWRKGGCVGVRNYLGVVFMACLFDHWGLWKIISLPGLLGMIVTIHASNPSCLMMNVATWFIGDYCNPQSEIPSDS